MMKLFNKLSKLIIAPIIVLLILMSNHTFLEDGIDSSKLLVNPASAEVSPDVFGYNPTFDQELDKIGQISPQEFAKRYDAKVDYLTQISWDPTQAKFWDLFNDSFFRLNSEELEVFNKQGFVVSERMGTKSFAQSFYQIYNNDLPVFVSADALLHAWHRSYDAMLEELEESYLATSLDEILTGMADKIPEASNQYGDGVLDLSLIDADYFLAVARSLLAGETVKSKLNQDARVAATFQAIEGEQLQKFELFGRDRKMDFSQFKVRGHYENSETLKKYFQAVMWCGRVDLRIAGKPEEASPRELGAAIILNDLLKQSGKFEQWQQFDQMLQTFVGPTDSMTFAQLADLLKQAKIQSPTDIKDLSTLEQLQTEILANNLGFQNIRSHFYYSPKDDDQIKDIIPHSFTVIGQKFILDSWMLSKVVYDDIIWNGKKVQRRVPSGLDVAFATLGNIQVVPELVDRITNQNGREFRDGLNYQHNLAAAFNVVEKLNPSAWEENLYMNWLATLRELSKPTTDSQYPEAMRTRTWGMKTLNTQLASWTQLRHDTILYGKQSYTGGTLCYYPAGFVEPRPEFWERFEKMAMLAGQLIENTPFPKHLRWIQQKQAKFFKNFSQQLTILKEIALKELAQQELTEAQTNFLENIVEIERASGGPSYSGWYPRLFYKKPKDSDKWDAIVADVHTNVPDPIVEDPGSVLHQGVGNIDLLMIAVDNGEDKMVFAGPVLSHYEFEMPGVSRKSDSEWKKDIKTGKLPPRPNWTKSYLVVNEFLNEFSPPGE